MGSYVGLKYNRGLSGLIDVQRRVNGEPSVYDTLCPRNNFESFTIPSAPGSYPGNFVGMGTKQWQDQTGVNGLNAINPPLLVADASGKDQNMLNVYMTSLRAGQDGNGFYSWQASDGSWWSGSDADGEMRTAYSQLKTAGVPQGFTGGIVVSGTGTLPAPQARGPQRAATGFVKSVGDVTGDIGAGLGAIVGGVGTVAGDILGAAGSLGLGGTPPPPPPGGPLPPFPGMLIFGFIAVILGVTSFIIAGAEQKK